MQQLMQQMRGKLVNVGFSCSQQHLKKTRENNPECCISARVAWNSFAIPCSSSALLFAATFEEKQHSAHHRFCVRIFCFLGPSSMDSCPMHARQFVRDFFRPGLKCGGLCSVTSFSPPMRRFHEAIEAIPRKAERCCCTWLSH